MSMAKKKAPTKKVASKKPKKLSKEKLEKLTLLVDLSMKSQAVHAVGEKDKARLNFDPYAPGTWSVNYQFDPNTKEVSANFFKLTKAEQTKEKKRLSKSHFPLIDEETVEEAMDKMTFKSNTK
jgi:hypothetical protein